MFELIGMIVVALFGWAVLKGIYRGLRSKHNRGTALEAREIATIHLGMAPDEYNLIISKKMASIKEMALWMWDTNQLVVKEMQYSWGEVLGYCAKCIATYGDSFPIPKERFQQEYWYVAHLYYTNEINTYYKISRSTMSSNTYLISHAWRMIGINHNDPDCIFDKAWDYYYRDPMYRDIKCDSDSALLWFERAIEQGHLDSYLYAAELYESKGEDKKAEAYYLKACEFKVQDAEEMFKQYQQDKKVVG
ncbi:hypothetical protein ACS83_02760 [Vibrio alginolyticus]|uniref:hypothetical protein n=1 Tax=Vibrio alginolyticus TaxID=663 RepID=UPI0006A631C4|nr:hypothetical protein [Vibrio alginolyticus]KOE07662.1 hypothetical protein ACS83_02760 [Vibrio alginolyticus]